MKNVGCSILIQLNLYDGYLPYIDEIKKFCMDNFGALPQIAVTRKEDIENGGISDVELHTDKTKDEYFKVGEEFKSPLFDYTSQNFMVRRKEFCYAGDWSFNLNLATGMMRRCYFEKESQNIFKDIDKPIKFKAVGNNCECKYCMNSSHFMSLGVIPENYTKSYVELRNREEAKWYSDEMKSFLSTKLFENNEQYSNLQKKYINIDYKMKNINRKCLGKVKKFIKKKRK